MPFREFVGIVVSNDWVISANRTEMQAVFPATWVGGIGRVTDCYRLNHPFRVVGVVFDQFRIVALGHLRMLVTIPT